MSMSNGVDPQTTGAGMIVENVSTYLTYSGSVECPYIQINGSNSMRICRVGLGLFEGAVGISLLLRID